MEPFEPCTWCFMCPRRGPIFTGPVIHMHLKSTVLNNTLKRGLQGANHLLLQDRQGRNEVYI